MWIFYRFRLSARNICDPEESKTMRLHGMRFDGDENLFLKKWESIGLGMRMYGIDYENLLKWLFGCIVGLVVDFFFLSKGMILCNYIINNIILMIK